MTTTRAAQVTAPNAPLELVSRELRAPGPGQVQIAVRACGVCHSDLMVKAAAFPGMALPRVPGHEVVGVVSEVGAGVRGFSAGDRVGVGWHGGHCFVCDPCRAGDFIMCREEKICGIHYDGGYAQHLIAPAEALARVPDELSDVDAAPLMCAGITTFNALRNARLRPGDLVAVQGLGGLGHLGVQFARASGFHTVAVARGQDKRALAEKLGAHDYVDSAAGDPAAALQKLGGAAAVLATAPSAAAVESVIGGLGPGGQIILVGAFQEPLPVSAMAVIMQRRAVQGWPSGTAKDSEDTLRFALRHGVRPMTETFPLDQANEAIEHMLSGKVRFRAVLVP
jgi:D-arabinose 1-dehydrogenase-like Zn-dependent alcohol dehydrogenase